MIVKDIPKLYTAAAEFFSCIVVIILLRYKITSKNILKCIVVPSISLITLCLIQLFCGTVSGLAWLVGMFTAIIVMSITLAICLNLNIKETLYFTASAFIWAEFAASLEWQIESFYAPSYNYSNTYRFIVCIFLFAIVFSLHYFAEIYAWKDSLNMRLITITVGDVLRIWLAVTLFFIISNLSYVKIQSPFSGSTLQEIFNIRTLVDFAGVIMVELFHIQKSESDQRREMDTIKQTLYLQYMQYRQSSENMELINQKYHDLKHQLQVIRLEENNKKRLEYIDEMEHSINFYDAKIETGNYVLDTILTDKSRQCLKQNISMTVVADGKLLDFMHVMDIATIFGNALDNAIEHEVLNSAIEDRMIHVTISKPDGFIHIVIENKFSGILKSDGDHILTTKNDERFHGYGLKSIKYTIEKYGGFMAAGVDDGWFKLKLLVPFQ